MRKGALIIPAHFCCPFGGYVRHGTDGLLFEAYPGGANVPAAD
jgi:hypothetical protein